MEPECVRRLRYVWSALKTIMMKTVVEMEMMMLLMILMVEIKQNKAAQLCLFCGTRLGERRVCEYSW